jgi:prophage tail gpP-like protein
MFRDEVTLTIGTRQIADFASCSIEADMYTSDHMFSMELSHPETPVTVGQEVTLKVNGQTELTGIIGRRVPSYDKRSLRLTVHGRDVLGWLVDACCEQFITLKGVTLQQFAETLLAKAPDFVKGPGIIYQQNVVGNLKKKRRKGTPALSLLQDTAQAYARIQPGQTVFDVLKTYALSRGMIFYALPKGTLVFGQPLAGGAPSYYLTTRRDNPSGNNVKAAELNENVSKRYSKVTVVGQQQGQEVFGPNGAPMINTGGPQTTVTDSRFPFYKPFVAVDNNDARSPLLHAQMLLQKMRADGYMPSYTVAGHSQNGQNWQINKMCHVVDQVLNIEEDFLIYGRTFERSKRRGTVTHLRLGYPGIMA